jgi:predicted acylesterase/phospholipase RssA
MINTLFLIRIFISNTAIKNPFKLILFILACSFGFRVVAAVDTNTRDVYYFAVKGGVSLGSYETGLNRTLLHYVRQQQDEVVAFSGASAGSINSVLSAVDSCIEDKRITTQDNIALNDSQSENFMRWSWDIGIKDLVPARDAISNEGNNNKQRGIFNRAGFLEKKKLIKKLIERDGIAGCNMIITMSITKVEPYQYKINEIGETVKLQRFVIPLQVFVDENRKLVFRNYKDIHQPLDKESIQFPTPYLLLVENEQGLVDFDDVWDLGLASSAFPLAFSPVPLSYCYPLELEKGQSCTRGRATTEFFSDGGFFDNSPIGVSLDVYDHKSKSNAGVQRPIKLIYINPDSYRSREEVEQKIIQDHSISGLYDYGTYFVNSLTTALDSEYRSALKRLSSIGSDRRSFYMTNRFHHLLADLHQHFGAFYAAEYRQHDYLVGVYDGQHLIAQIQCDTNTERSGKNINRFDPVYQSCVREELMQWIKSQPQQCFDDTRLKLSHQDSNTDFFRYLYNIEFDKSLAICQEKQNLNIALSKAFGTVSVTHTSQTEYSKYLDSFDTYAKDLNIARGSDMERILKDGRKFTAEKLSGIYENIIQMQQTAANCETCSGRLGNQYIGTALKVAEPIVDSFLYHHDSQIWPLPINDVLAVSYGFNMHQKNHVLGLEYRPKALTFSNLSIDMSLAYHDFGQALADDDYISLGVGLMHHNDENAFLLSTWGVGYQYESKGDNVYDTELDSVYLKGGFLNELLSLKYLYRLEDIQQHSVITRASQAVVMTVDVSKLCKMVLPGWCGR